MLLLALLPPALLQVAMILAVELPDARSDAQTGKRNLVVRMGADRAARLYAALLGAAYLVLPLTVALGLPGLVAAAAAVPAPLALWRIWRVSRGDHREDTGTRQSTFLVDCAPHGHRGRRAAGVRRALIARRRSGRLSGIRPCPTGRQSSRGRGPRAPAAGGQAWALQRGSPRKGATFMSTTTFTIPETDRPEGPDARGRHPPRRFTPRARAAAPGGGRASRRIHQPRSL